MGYEPTTCCRYCGEPFDAYVAIEERVCGNCKETVGKIERAELGVDGDHAFALLGNDIQMGEAVFVKVENNDTWHTADKADAESRAATKAYRELQAKIGKPISYYIGPSHPRHC